MHFNGTAGVWRRTTIDDGGGWQHDTLTEDLDLSYRCQLKGWQFVYLPQFCAPAELPPEMIAFKQQAHRWTKGSMQTAIKLLPAHPALQAPAAAHQERSVLPPDQHDRLSADGAADAADVSDVLLRCSARSSTHSWSQYALQRQPLHPRDLLGQHLLRLRPARTLRQRGRLEIAPVYAAADGAGRRHRHQQRQGRLRSHLERHQEETQRIRPHAQVRYRRSVARPHQAAASRVFTFNRLVLPIIEIAFGCYMACCLWISLWYQCGILPGSDKSGWASVPFLLIFAGGYFYVGFGSLQAMYQMSQEDEEEVIDIPELTA